MITLENAPTTRRLNTTPDRSAHRALDLKSAELTTIAATALRYPPEQLKIHIESALRVGCSPEEIMDVIVQMALYAGLPAVETGVRAAQAVFHKLELEQGV